MCPGHHYKPLHTRRFKQKSTVSQLWRLQVQDQDVVGLVSFEALLLGLQMTAVFSVPSRGLSVCAPLVPLPVFEFPPLMRTPVVLD